MTNYNINYINIIERNLEQYCANKRNGHPLSIPFEQYEDFLKNSLHYSTYNNDLFNKIKNLLNKIAILKKDSY